MVQVGALPPLCNLLTVADSKVITVALEGIENILKVAQASNHLDKVVEIINDCNGVGAIEDLQSHNNKQIYLRAVKVLETYFGAEEETESEIIPDLVTGAGGAQLFNFGPHNANNPPGGFQF